MNKSEPIKEQVVNRFLKDGKITKLPAKYEARNLVLEYLSDKFEAERDYTEKEVNAILNEWHTFNDYFLLRRELVDRKLLSRTNDGARYWKTER